VSVSINLSFKFWGPFHANKDPDAVRQWLDHIGKASVDAFRNGMVKNNPPPYNNSSAPGEWPANRTGDLKGSIRHEVNGNVLTVGTGEIYAVYLRYGTTRMARRKMSDDALREGMKSAGNIKRWVGWTRP
jgi:phage gpG-like protein